MLIVVYAAMVLLSRRSREMAFFDAVEARPMVIAHQGGEHLWPSNTMLAFQNAVDLGVDVLEMDIHASAENQIVTIHDDTVDRTTNGAGRITELTLAELKDLDAGHYWTEDGQTYPFRGQGVTIATLEEIFEAFPDTPMNIEIKQESPSIAASFCDMLRTYERTDLTLVASFSTLAMNDFRAACPEVATSLVSDEMRNYFYRYLAWLGQTFSPPGEAAQVPEYNSGYHILTPRFVRASHQRGMEVHAWTINEADDLQRMIDLGVDGIITDRPDLLLELLGR